MTTALLDFIVHSFSLDWLTGPIFDKELRVSSRRRRNYVLRSAYLLSLTLLLGMFWVEASQRGGSPTYLASQMAEMGKLLSKVLQLALFPGSAAWILICMGVYGLLSSLFAWRARCGLRRNVF